MHNIYDIRSSCSIKLFILAHNVKLGIKNEKIGMVD
jgi:hypothetical protein